MKAVLVLEDGKYFTGESFGSTEDAIGEVVFNTGMTGYQEVTTDPSYNGQMVCMTYPLIGNYGMNDEDIESERTHTEGFIVKELCDYHSNFRATMAPEEYFKKHGITGIKGVDTRAITQHIRNFGSMNGIISTKSGNITMLLEKLKKKTAQPVDLVAEVSVNEKYEIPGDGGRIAFIDFGVKMNTIRSLRDQGCHITVFPHDATSEEIFESNPDAVLISNGPGDPRDLEYAIPVVRDVLKSGLPVLGICLGHQLIALALGMKIFKMKFGHHGGNHPVRYLSTGKCRITSQNHNYAVSEEDLPDDVEITQKNVNDGTVEAFTLKNRPVISVQYHPEASPGPEDSSYIFKNFIGMIQKGGNNA